jgi:hypothetical protein
VTFENEKNDIACSQNLGQNLLLADQGIVAAVHHHEGRVSAAVAVVVAANVKDDDAGGRFSSNITGIIAPVATTTWKYCPRRSYFVRHDGGIRHFHHHAYSPLQQLRSGSRRDASGFDYFSDCIFIECMDVYDTTGISSDENL